MMTKLHRTGIVLIFTLSVVSGAVLADREQWKREAVDWRAGAGSRIKAVHHPAGQDIPQGRARVRAKTQSRAKARSARAVDALSAATLGAGVQSASAVFAYDIEVNSPPVDGFVPWIAVSVTKKNSGELEFEAVPQSGVAGNYPLGVNPDEDYVIGLYDTGASAHVMGYEAARQCGIYSSGMITSNESIISGVTGSVAASITYPLGMFIDGLYAIDTGTLRLDRSGMKGQSNVAIMVGQNPGNHKDLPTAIGSPMSVYYTAVIYNDRPLTVEREGEVYTAPDIRIYEHDDERIPELANKIPLELRPLGAVSVQYIPTLDLGGLGGLGGGWDDILGGIGGGVTSDFPPASPSVIIGNASQSLFFVHSVDLYSNGKTAMDKNRFMLDTGAQVTVIGTRIAARLKLSPADADFEVEIEGVTGDVVMHPGFYVESIEIPALGNWVSFKNVPVVLLDISSPEGGTLDGIIGMNLFNEFNLVLQGGGLSLEEDPYLAFEPIAVDEVIVEDPNQ
ncbi:MAG: retropepsin-like domain-containing protein [Phycisphaerae bacterium]|nr:retropepsin-like domain-containing protein [Phycisphaerae bacterium]